MGVQPKKTGLQKQDGMTHIYTDWIYEQQHVIWSEQCLQGSDEWSQI
jgi:hypothetical protein